MYSTFIKGKIGKDLTLEHGQEAARLCVINILAQVKKAVKGDLSKVKNCVKITGFVNSTDDFKDHDSNYRYYQDYKILYREVQKRYIGEFKGVKFQIIQKQIEDLQEQLQEIIKQTSEY